jgi:hypothetical protein
MPVTHAFLTFSITPAIQPAQQIVHQDFTKIFQIIFVQNVRANPVNLKICAPNVILLYFYMKTNVSKHALKNNTGILLQKSVRIVLFFVKHALFNMNVKNVKSINIYIDLLVYVLVLVQWYFLISF